MNLLCVCLRLPKHQSLLSARGKMASVGAAASSSSSRCGLSSSLSVSWFVPHLVVLGSPESHSPAHRADKVDPFSIGDPAEFADWLKAQLPTAFHGVVDTLCKNMFEGEGFRDVTKQELKDDYGLTPGAAAKIVAVRNKVLGGTYVIIVVGFFVCS